MCLLFSQEVCLGWCAVCDFGTGGVNVGRLSCHPWKAATWAFKHVNGSAGHDHLLCEVGSAAFGIRRGGPPWPAPLAYEKGVGCMYTLAVVAGVFQSEEKLEIPMSWTCYQIILKQVSHVVGRVTFCIYHQGAYQR